MVYRNMSRHEMNSPATLEHGGNYRTIATGNGGAYIVTPAKDGMQ
jgi:hypothetical protein